MKIVIPGMVPPSQQMGHASASLTALYTREIPVEVVKNFLQLEPNGAAVAA
jgi:hypothetical protein